jgi:hypothetical protein
LKTRKRENGKTRPELEGDLDKKIKSPLLIFLTRRLQHGRVPILVLIQLLGLNTPFQGYLTQVTTQPDGLESIESQRNLSHQNEASKNVAGEKKKRAFYF